MSPASASPTTTAVRKGARINIRKRLKVKKIPMIFFPLKERFSLLMNIRYSESR